MNELVQEYKDCIDTYNSFTTKVEELIKELLILNRISYHKIEARTKTAEKLEEKITRKSNKYDELDEITDLVGIRVITYFDDEVDKIAGIISKEFKIDEGNSIDKRKLDIDRFGYKSLHYVVTLLDERQGLSEYKRFGNKKFEIQIRSILQHAWAEIEHDLGYKGKQTIPDTLKRDFYRVAALLETADIEFTKIKNQLKDYEQNVSKIIATHPEEVDINSASLRTYINNSIIVKKIDERIAKGSHSIVKSNLLEVSPLVEKIHFLGISSVKELNSLLVENEELIVNFASDWLIEGLHVKSGISIFYLMYVLIAIKQDRDFAKIYADTFFGNLNTERIFNTYNKIIENTVD